MSLDREAVDRVKSLLRELPGIVMVAELDRSIQIKMAEIEREYEPIALLPIDNLGLKSTLEREVVFALLKDRRFRAPPKPTIYLVEELDDTEVEDRHCLTAEKRKYRIIGEELLDASTTYSEKTIPLGDSFVVFPKRRNSRHRPSYFLLPPLAFPELEKKAREWGITDIISSSPSSPTDAILRASCQFPADKTLATLLVAFNRMG